MKGSVADSLQWATHRLDDAVAILGSAERELADVSDRLAEDAHAALRQVEALHADVARVWRNLDGAA